jgi:hypothetical protein
MIPQSTFCDGNLRRALERLGRYQRPQASLIYSWISIYCLIIEPSFDGRGCVDELSAIL